MKTLCLLALFPLASACSSFGVRCDTHLRPINLPQPPLNGLPAGAPTPKVSAPTSGSGSPEKP
jgi:hypothetical protein